MVFWKFAFTEFLNFVILVGNFWFMDMFLQGKFWYFGIDVINFSRLHPDEQKFKPNPFCQVFPLETSCTLPSVGAGGGEQETNGLCVLSQNIINQKMYLVLWFWMTFLIMITPLCLIYRIITIWFDCFRSALLMAQIGNTNDAEARKATKIVSNKCYLGDWFVLYQISKNANMYFFRAFIKELKISLVPRKKKFNLSSENSTLKKRLPHIEINILDESKNQQSESLENKLDPDSEKRNLLPNSSPRPSPKLLRKADDNDGANPSPRYWPIKMTNKRLTKAPKSKMGSKATMDGTPKINVGAMGKSKGKGGRRVKNDRLSALDERGGDDDD